MNIQQAKQAIAHTVTAYLHKDALGNYAIPTMRQRPVLLMGPPGIGKTQIMAQIAGELDIGLVSYTITHHTRQSAMGLPFIQQRTFSGTEHTVTAYTMSEILASVHTLIADTHLSQGILFLDEINCVSETLAPMMLQFLQCKTFGNQALPQGWVIVAAGNPPEYNKSVRSFDVVTLDRIKPIHVTADYDVWRTYASEQGIHNSILSYLDLKRDHFYRMEAAPEGMQFVTARGWEDLSELMYVYQDLNLPVTQDVIAQYLQLPQVARDFSLYLALYQKYRSAYSIDDIVSGTWQALTATELGRAPFDEALCVLGLLLSRLEESALALHRQQDVTTALHGTLGYVKGRLDAGESGQSVLLTLVKERQESLERRKHAGQSNPHQDWVLQREAQLLSCFTTDSAQDWEALHQAFQGEVSALETAKTLATTHFDQAFAFLDQALGESHTLVLFLTQLTASYQGSWFVETYGCEGYFKHNKSLLLEDKYDDIRQRIAKAQGR